MRACVMQRERAKDIILKYVQNEKGKETILIIIAHNCL